MAKTVTESRIISQPIDRVYEICRSEAFLLTSGEDKVNVVEKEYEQREDGTVYSKLVAEQALNSGDAESNSGGGGEGESSATGESPQMPKTMRMTQESVVSGFVDDSFSINSHAPMPFGMGTLDIQFDYVPNGEGTQVTARATAESKVPIFGRKVVKEVLTSIPDSLDKTVSRIDALAKQTWGE